MTNNNLALNEGLLVERIELTDINAFFSRVVEIPPGIQVIVYEDGVNLGVLGEGRYTLETFADRLRFWKRKHATLYVFRSNFFAVDYASETFPTKDGFTVSASVRTEFSVMDPSLLTKNLVGPAPQYSIDEFCQDTEATVIAALKTAFHNFPIDDLDNPETKRYLDAAMEMAICSAFGRYGFKFESMTLLSLSHEAYDRIKIKAEELVSDRREHEEDKKRSEFENERRFDDIRRQEQSNEMEILAGQVEADRTEGKLSLIQRRNAARRELRDQIQSDKFDRISTEAEFDQFQNENRKAGLIRDSEYIELRNALNQEKTDKDKRRAAALRILDLQLDRDWRDFQSESDYQAKRTALDRESEIAQRVDTESNRRWQSDLERERVERRENIARKENERDINRVASDIDMENAFARQRIQTVELEMKAGEEANALEIEKRRDLWKVELQSKTWGSQLERLEAVQKLNQDQSRFEMDLLERKNRLEAELEITRKAQEQKFELDRMAKFKDFGENGLLGLLNPDQAANLAHIRGDGTERARFDTDRVRLEERSERLSEMNEKMQTMFQQMMNTQERTMDRFVNMHASTPPTTPSSTVVVPGALGPTVVAGSQPTSPNAGVKVMLCPKCRCEVEANQKFCHNCGERL